MKKALVLILVALITITVFVSCKSTAPINATSNELGHKMGQSQQSMLFHFLPIGGNGAIYDAARNGGISKISTVDQTMVDYLGVFQVVTTVVTGD